MKKTAALIALAESVESKYSIVKTATLSDVLLDCLNDMDRYLKNPLYDDWYGDSETQAKIARVKESITDLVRYLNTPPSMMKD